MSSCRWLYLEPVFNRGALLKEAGRFRRLDADFRFIIAEMKRDSLVSSILRVPNLRSLISNILDQVGRCQKSLFEFLEVMLKTPYLGEIRNNPICVFIIYRRNVLSLLVSTFLGMRTFWISLGRQQTDHL